MRGVWYELPQSLIRLRSPILWHDFTKDRILANPRYFQDLCRAALEFSFDILKTGGHLVCKFYQGAEDKALEKQLKLLFQKVHREKPESSRSVSKCAPTLDTDQY